MMNSADIIVPFENKLLKNRVQFHSLSKNSTSRQTISLNHNNKNSNKPLKIIKSIISNDTIPSIKSNNLLEKKLNFVESNKKIFNSININVMSNLNGKKYSKTVYRDQNKRYIDNMTQISNNLRYSFFRKNNLQSYKKIVLVSDKPLYANFEEYKNRGDDMDNLNEFGIKNILSHKSKNKLVSLKHSCKNFGKLKLRLTNSFNKKENKNKKYIKKFKEISNINELLKNEIIKSNTKDSVYEKFFLNFFNSSLKK